MDVDYHGNSFNIVQHGDVWHIWRYTGDEDETEEIHLTTEAMKELRQFFAEEE